GLEKIVGYKIPSLHIVGGGCKEKTLCRFTASAINRPVYAGPIEATAIGNLSTQLISLGEVGSLDQAREVVANSFPMDVYLPQNPADWELAYEKLLSLQL
ncbi:MAG: rhamnulokinase, partial [Clostridia bacterium]|nr:rhamnulokinase [Clostridia bacterium]